MTLRRSDWSLILILFTTGLFAAWQFGKVALVLPQVAGAYGRTPEGVAWLVSVVGVVGILLGAVGGNLVASFGARRVLLFAVWLGAGLSTLQVIGLPLPALAVTRAAEGLSHLLIVVAAPVLIAGAASDSGRSIAMGLWATFFGVAFALGAVIFPPLVAAVGLPGLFIAHAAGFAALALLLSARLPRQPRMPLGADLIAQHTRIYGTPRRAMPGLCFVFYTMLFVALVTLIPVALHRPGLAAILPLISLTGTFGAGWLARRIPAAWLLVIGFVGCLLSAALIWGGATWGVFSLFATMGLVPGAAFALIPVLNPGVPDRALATGGIAQMGNVGSTLGTPIFATLLATGGEGGLWGGVALFSVGGLAATAALAHLVRRERAAGVPV
ncbi:MFS transporter [Palleronia sp.]|uniref:MFS transporter n=1 Tax=Palleronia sp. TaxID=1940284 RepID=UPI0035C8087F